MTPWRETIQEVANWSVVPAGVLYVCPVCMRAQAAPGIHWHGQHWGCEAGDHELIPYVPMASHD